MLRTARCDANNDTCGLCRMAITFLGGLQLHSFLYRNKFTKDELIGQRNSTISIKWKYTMQLVSLMTIFITDYFLSVVKIRSCLKQLNWYDKLCLCSEFPDFEKQEFLRKINFWFFLESWRAVHKSCPNIRKCFLKIILKYFHSATYFNMYIIWCSGTLA